MIYPPGEYVHIRNLTNLTISDLLYDYHEYEGIKVRKIKAHQKENFMIITTNLKKDYDLTFYFENDRSKKFTFPNAVKKMTCDTTWCYLFYKIVENNGEICIEVDEEGEKEFKSE